MGLWRFLTDNTYRVYCDLSLDIDHLCLLIHGCMSQTSYQSALANATVVGDTGDLMGNKQEAQHRPGNA